MNIPYTLKSQRLLKKLLPLGLLFFIHHLSLAQQDTARLNIIRNYGFENFDVVERLISWNPQNTRNQYRIEPHADSHTGELSMKITPRSGAEENFGVGHCNSIITKADLLGKKKLTIRAFIKTENLADGIASLWMQLNGNAGSLLTRTATVQAP